MALKNKNYVPTLAIRASEMNGLEFLPGATKDRMTPCILLAPWANSSTLERAIDRVRRAFPNRQYILDLDRDYQFTNPESGPQQEMMRLLDPTDAYSNWVEFVSEHEELIPCIQSRDQSEAEIRQQIMAFQGLGRQYCMRIVRDRFPNNFDEIVAAFAAGGTADFFVILEGGWTLDPLTLSAWFDGLIAGGLMAIEASVPVVVSCTSMPKLFSNYSGATEVPFHNRRLVDQLRRQTNRTSVVYGDWGSTRPREPGGFANRPLDRIDYPTENSWIIVRNKDEKWDFEDAAEELVKRSGVWDGSLNVWGEEMIYQTTINEEIGIDTPQKNVAARVNIHLHRQAFYGQQGLSGMDFEEDWED
ncbi:hypothetical protein CBW24_07880 [Pacificitalea manganoxidans]|uniref:T4 beta protein n=1 Tax=Pacificitalea manganoxidans TaxID=1411902 RepID=A0A291LZJ3_9RHOB|nr:beta family protein [Pacificitalea manganoxidans]ATI41928.1 hypothetical protein CBW24_07880 [Pacificitalea manganoxidans]MDR6309414.1 hypothetical protein [Pacificitalea manganoxidans]